MTVTTETQSLLTVASARRRSSRAARGEFRASAAMLLPALLLLLAVYGYPVVAMVVESLRFPVVGGAEFGLRNFEFVLADPVFWTSAKNNALFIVIGVPVVTVLAVLIAVVLYELGRWGRVYRAFFFLPYIVAVPVLALAFSYIFGLHGILNAALEGIGLGFLAQDWLGDPALVPFSVLSVIVFRELGFGIVLLLARLTSVQEELWEAARIDGAGWWQRLRYITVPQLWGVIKFFMVIEVTSMITYVFAYVYAMTAGGPGNASSVVELYVYKNAFGYQATGMASAAAVLLLAVSIVVMALQLAIRRKDDDDVRA